MSEKLTKKKLKKILKDGFLYTAWKNNWNTTLLFQEIIRLALVGIKTETSEGQ
jgi:hypothetical protein